MPRLIAPLLIGLVGLAILLWLGFWQLQRLDWKEGILSEIDGRIAADPVPVPSMPDPERDRFLPVTVTGEITDQELHFLVSTKETGPGFRIVSLFLTEDGRRLLLDRGIVDDNNKFAERPPVTATITGNLHWPEETDMFTPEPDRTMNMWFARDVETISAELATEPVLIVLRTTTEETPPVRPFPVSASSIPNDHLQYAVTWFGLALVWAGMTVYWIVRIRRGQS